GVDGAAGPSIHRQGAGGGDGGAHDRRLDVRGRVFHVDLLPHARVAVALRAQVDAAVTRERLPHVPVDVISERAVGHPDALPGRQRRGPVARGPVVLRAGFDVDLLPELAVAIVLRAELDAVGIGLPRAE